MRRLALPSEDELVDRLITLWVPHEDIDTAISLLPRLKESSELSSLLEGRAAALIDDIGVLHDHSESQMYLPALGDEFDSLGRYFYLFVFLLVLPYAEEYFEKHGVPPEIRRRTLADLGGNMAENRLWFGEGGIQDPKWLSLHFRGMLYSLGRLQFERSRIGPSLLWKIQGLADAVEEREAVLFIHIPRFAGPLTSPACSLSLDRASNFFTRHAFGDDYRIAICSSWLLDVQLAKYLPASSNILSFQRRFGNTLTSLGTDDAAVRFVFGPSGVTPEIWAGMSTLERAIIDHRSAGGEWRRGAGWIRLSD